jgi:hypothetical protein
MRLPLAALILLPTLSLAQTPAAQTGAGPAVASLADVKRIYVAPLIGGPQADALRALIIDSIESSKLFILTDNEERADAILKGAADDRTFTDTFDTEESGNTHFNTGVYTGTKAASSTSKGSAGGYGGSSVGINESHHDKERKHEAYAAIRLCNRDGDVLWSTSQESKGGKFKGASADVAAKVAKQLAADLDRLRRPEAPASAARPESVPVSVVTSGR